MDVGFDDGGTASGTFTYNFTSATITDWNITVSGGTTGTFPARSYTMENSMSSVTFSNPEKSLADVGFLNPSEGTGGIIIVAPITSAGGTPLILVGPGLSLETNASHTIRRMNSGSLVGTIVV